MPRPGSCLKKDAAQLVIAVLAVGAVLLRGFFSLQPNQARVLVLFGSYKGTVRTSGFHWANPFYSNDRQGRTIVDRRTCQDETRLNGTSWRFLGPK